jgi:A/G-specific adenine glycosylase
MRGTVTAKAKKVKAAIERPDPARLLAWYDRYRRVLPWRAPPGVVSDPYQVWLSEVMLQQTVVATVIPYFQKFIQRWPRLADLAAADLDDVLRMWAGLGYYRRARFLHECARTVMADYGGVFPRDEAALRALPGFGPYTAAAVAAIAFNRPANVVDGNVERVMARIFAITEEMPKAKPALRAAAATLVPAKRCGDYAQALMDLGATVCTPSSPKCGLCPWADVCSARAQGIAVALPRRAAKAERPQRRAIAFVLFDGKGRVWLRRRAEQGLLAGMTEPPSSPWLEQKMPALPEVSEHAPAKATWKCLRGTVRHIFTHFALEVGVAVAVSPKKPKGDGFWVALDCLDAEALPSVMKKIVVFAARSL